MYRCETDDKPSDTNSSDATPAKGNIDEFYNTCFSRDPKAIGESLSRPSARFHPKTFIPPSTLRSRPNGLNSTRRIEENGSNPYFFKPRRTNCLITVF